MKAKCPHCKNKWSVSRKYSGATVNCPSCRAAVGLAPSAPIFALMSAVLISSALSVGVSYWLISTKTDIGRNNAETAELQTKMTALTAKTENFNTELAKIQTDLKNAVAQAASAKPLVAQTDAYSMMQIDRVRYTDAATDPNAETKPDQPKPQLAEQKLLDDIDSLLIFEGVITSVLDPQTVLGKPTKKVSQFTYSNFRYVPPFVGEETAAIKFISGETIPQDAKGSKLTMHVVLEGTYDYKETIGALEIPKTVKLYRQTNIKNPPKQQLVEFQGDQPIPGARRGLSQQRRQPARGGRPGPGGRLPQRPRPR
ncbi:MAG: hypothetical protein ACYTFK_09910 [Planctomycetota bacterium]